MNLCLKFGVIAGTDRKDAASDLVKMANRLGVMTSCDFNGQQMLAMPGDDPGAVLSEFVIMWESKYPPSDKKANVSGEGRGASPRTSPPRGSAPTGGQDEA